jgi:hypothetical protein
VAVARLTQKRTGRLARRIYASLADKAIHALFHTELNFSCIPPECRWGENTRLCPSSAF